MLIIVSILVVGCSKDKNNSIVEPEPEKIDPLIPLAIGNYWLYQSYYLNPDDGSINYADTWKFGFIIDDTLTQIINGKRVLNYKFFNCGEELKPYYDKPGSFTGSKLIYQDKLGMYYSGMERYDTLKASFNELIFPYPVQKGDVAIGHEFYYSTTGNYLSGTDDMIQRYTCVSTDSLFSTPVGDFKCIVYKMVYYGIVTLSQSEVYYFIKPGIGIVGLVDMIYFYKTNTYHYFRKTVLTEYKLK